MVILKMPNPSGPSFARYIGIDYSGAETPNSSLKGLRVYQAGQEILPTEVPPPPSPRKYWTRRGIAAWLVEQLTEDIPTSCSAVVESYPALWKKAFAREDRTDDQHDAYSVAAWLRQADLDGSLARFLNPSLLPGERAVAQVEGWILGVM